MKKINTHNTAERTKAGHFLLGFLLIASYFLLFTDFAHAQSFNLIVCDPVGSDPCGFDDITELIKNLISALMIVSTFLATAAFAYAGILLLSSGGSSGKKDEAKKVASKVLVGYLWILGAWVLIYTITSVLLRSDFQAPLTP